MPHPPKRLQRGVSHEWIGHPLLLLSSLLNGSTCGTASLMRRSPASPPCGPLTSSRLFPGPFTSLISTPFPCPACCSIAYGVTRHCCSRGRGTDHCSHPSLWGCGRAQPDHRGPSGALQVPTGRVLALGCSRCLNEGFGAGRAALPPHHHGSAPASAFSVVTPSLKAPRLPGTL